MIVPTKTTNVAIVIGVLRHIKWVPLFVCFRTVSHDCRCR